MKQLLKSLSAFSASAAIAVCSMTSGLTYADETEQKTSCTLHYDLSEEGVTIPEDEDGNVPELKDQSVSPNSSVYLTDIIPEKEGYSFSGWTEDFIRGYEASDVFRMTDKDVTLHPVWVEKNDKEFHTVFYKVIINGVEDEDAKLRVPDKKLLTGRIFKVPLDVFTNPGYKQRGWTDGVNEFLPETKLVVNDKDITLYPNYKKIYNLIYTVGDADRVSGVTKLEYEIAEGDSTNLQSNSRFSRNGFKVKGWHCETDGKDYKPDAYFEMPGNDVIMTPIWEPIRYVVVFKQNSNSADNIKVPGYTDTAIIAPECTIVKENAKFSGWQRDDVIIQPGEEYIIPGAPSGMGIAFTAVWSTDSGDTTTTTTTGTSTITTTTTIKTTSSATSSISTTTANSSTSTTSNSVTSTGSSTSATTTVTEPCKSTYGDANCDGTIDMSDVVLIMQSLANPNKYDINGTDANHITAAGKANADVWNTGDGVTTQDALHIQKYLLGLCEITAKVTVSELPE